MSSPFTFFRRNQHVTMVGIVILAMMAFTLDAVFSQQGSHYVMLGLMMGGIIFAFMGLRTGRWLQYGAAGAVLGALCGWVFPEVITPANEAVRTSTLGTFDQKRISELMLRRTIANVFMQQAFEKAYGPGTSRFAPIFQYYPDNVEDDMTFGELMRAEADDLGIVVTDRMVSQYINQRTDEKLTAADYAQIRNNLNLRGTVVSDKELFDSFRDEIKAQLAYQHLNPYFASVPQAPEVYYEIFKRTKVSQRLNTVRLDVDAFVSEVPDPSEAEVASLYADNRLKYPDMEEPGSPGFRQPPKSKLAYLELSYKAVEKAVTPPTDAEVETYYNQNKERLYKKIVDPTSEDLEGSAEPEKSAEEPKPEEPKAEEPKPEEPKPEEPKPEEPKPEEPKPEEPKPEEPKPEEPGDQCLPFGDESSTEAQEDAKPTPAATTENAELPAAQAAETTATPAETPAVPESAGASGEVPTAGSDAAGATPDFQIPITEYQPLNDDLKGEIRDRMLDEKVRSAIEEKMAAVMADLKLLGKEREKIRRGFVNADRDISNDTLYEKMQDASKKMSDGMKELTAKHGFEFVETPLVTYQDLSEGEAYPIGAATPPQANPFTPPGAPVAQQVFTSFPNDIFDDTNLFVHHQAVKNAFDLDGGEVHFAWWITEFAAQHVPKLTDTGIRDQVVLTWKRKKARDLAKKRAEELAGILRDGFAKPEAERKDMATLLEGQTILGKADSPALTVRQTQAFSWMEQSMTPQMNFMQQRPTLRRGEVRFSDETGGSVRYAGDKFMKTVFEEIENEAPGVVATEDLKSYFVVQPVERSGDEEILRQQFLTEGRQFGFREGPVAQILSTEIGNPASIAWERSIWAKYEVDRDTLPEE